jgi:broad specificity phosphatase PhoE
MKLIFVRHGKTEDLQEGISQQDASELSDIGINEAKSLAKKIGGEKIDVIIASTMSRAKQTAEIINEGIKAPLEMHDFLVEVKKPSVLVGRKRDEPEFKEIMQQLVENFHLNWHHSDEENFEDAKARALQALGYIQELKKETVMVVSHGTFMRLMVAILMFGEKCSSHNFTELNYFFGLNTTGVCRVDQGGWDGGWRLISWNDTSHLE